jgi:hypothetical protein
MHSAKALTSESFGLSLDGYPASLDEIFPGFHQFDRLGVVVRTPGGATGASGLIMAAVTRFYDFQRASGRDFFIYPDYFVFHVGGNCGDHNMLDIWPGHKEVQVAADAEEIIQSINDRGITRLLVEDCAFEPDGIKRHTRESAESRIVSVLIFAADGYVSGADVSVSGNAPTESYVSAVIEKSPAFDEGTRERLRSIRAALQGNGMAIEHYRRADLQAILGTPA